MSRNVELGTCASCCVGVLEMVLYLSRVPPCDHEHAASAVASFWAVTARTLYYGNRHASP